VSAERQLGDLRRELRRRGLDEVEVYLKEGRSRRYEIGPQGRISLESRERGWAVRAGSRHASWFAVGSGRLEPAGPWPEADGQPIVLPSPASVASWTAPPDLEAPLIAENEAIALLEGVERELGRQLAGARLARAYLEEGSSRSDLANSRGLTATVPARSAALYLEAERLCDGRPTRARLLLAARDARGFRPLAMAHRMVDLMVVRSSDREATRDRGDMLVAPPVAVALLEGVLPLLVGRAAAARGRALRDRSGRLGSDRLTVIDDGRLPGGVFEAPVDGEGVETRRAVLIEEGMLRQPLLSWREAAAGERWSGCVGRRGWREIPRTGPTHLFVKPDPAVGVGSLLGAVSRGFYLLGEEGPARVDLEGDRFELPVSGFSLRQGRAVEPFARAQLTGSVRALLQGVQGVARDLTFRPRRGLLGSPTLLLAGLELRSR